MIFERFAFVVVPSMMCLGACELDPPPAPRGIDCERERAAERHPETCGDAGDDSGSDE